ncbi:MAG TPA: hypothetical protein VK054_06185, partial [Beutenbergiaceae bacterium]|nr:hypothetical protein [Beutenbergiaceae bacterium]
MIPMIAVAGMPAVGFVAGVMLASMAVRGMVMLLMTVMAGVVARMGVVMVGLGDRALSVASMLVCCVMFGM